ncbi:MAG: hypothetical protein HY698_17150 [Deltaproteobacteria bacterium]|nr:hypothetical protein [Deltaproteobacteria bacterium]
MRKDRFVLWLPLVLLPACSEEQDEEFRDWNLEDLGAERGFVFRTPVFEVPTGEEVQNCYFIEVPDLNAGSDIFVNRVVTAINPGSHHMNVFRVMTVVGLDGKHGDVVRGGECFRSSNWADWPLVANSQNSAEENPYTDWTLPQGVAQRFSPGEKLMVQVHYVNATTQKTPFKGRVGINFYRSPIASPIELGTLFATQQSIRICQSNPNPTFSGTCNFAAGEVHVAAASAHFHSRGRAFKIYTWDRQSLEPKEENKFYESTSWDDPPMATGLDVRLQGGGGIMWTCTYRWSPPPLGCDVLDSLDTAPDKDCCYTFGPKVDTNEHCNVFLYYWPKTQDVSCN